MFGSWSVALYLHFGLSLIFLACQSQSTFNVCMKTENKFYLSLAELNGLAFVYELSGCGTDSCCSDLNTVLSKEFYDIQLTKRCRFTLKHVCKMIRDFLPLYSVLFSYFIYRELRHLRFPMVEQLQSCLARIGLKRFLFV